MIITTNTSKGGETKTTSTVTFGSILAVAGYKVLLIDADPQQNLTYLCATEDTNVTPPIVIYDLLLRNSVDENELKEAVVSTKIQNMDMIPANDSLNLAPYHLYDKIVHENEPEHILNFRNNLLRIQEMFGYDYIFIDTPPSKNLYTVSAAIAAADYIIAGISPDNLSWQGLSAMIQAVDDNNITYGRNTQIAGVFLTRVNPRTNRYKEMKAGYEQLLGDVFLNSYIRTNESMGKANSYMVPIILFDKRCEVIEDYINVMIEIGLLDTNDWHYLELRKYIRGNSK